MIEGEEQDVIERYASTIANAIRDSLGVAG
jgi:hypothetical protein